jgi:hypothetical protein
MRSVTPPIGCARHNKLCRPQRKMVIAGQTLDRRVAVDTDEENGVSVARAGIKLRLVVS